MGVEGAGTSAIVAGGITQAVGQFTEEEAISQAEKTNASVARNEAAILGSKRKLDIIRERKKIRNFIGTQEALFAKAGVTASGSPNDILEDSLAEAELDIIIRDINTRIAQDKLLLEARIGESRAKRERTLGFIRAGTTLLETAGKVSARFEASKVDESSMRKA